MNTEPQPDHHRPEETVDPSCRPAEQPTATFHDTATDAVTSNSDTPGQRTVGDYELLDRLGAGGMGLVYRARQKSADRIVALKLIRPDRLDEFDESRRHQWLERFRTEAQAAAQLEHDHIVAVYHVGDCDGVPFYSMRYIDGQSLADVVRHQPLENHRAAELVEPIARAVHFAHQSNILHRDLKPQNILVDHNGRPFVADFGLAKCLELESSGATHTGDVIGTPSYMSPEQARDTSRCTPLSDVYSLGAILYELVTGRPPFRAATALDTLRQVFDAEPVSPRELNGAVDRDIETITLKCLSKEPSRRYGSAAALADDLRRWLNDEPIHARPVGIVERGRRWARRQPAAATAVAVVLIGLLSVTALSMALAIANQRLQTSITAETTATRNANSARWQAEQNATLAQQQSQLAAATLAAVVKDLQAGLANLPGGGEIRRRLLATSIERLELVATQYVSQATVDRYTWEALIDMGSVVLRFEDTSASESNISLAHTILNRAHEISDQLAKSTPHSQAQRDHSVSCINLGDVYLRLGNISEAFACFQRAVEINQALVAADPGNRVDQRELSTALERLGNCHERLGQTGMALEYYQQMLEIKENLAESHATDPITQRQLAVTLRHLARMNLKGGDWRTAESQFERAHRVTEQLATANPSDTQATRDLMVSHGSLGMLAMQTGELETAHAHYVQARDINQQLVASDPTDLLAQSDLAITFDNLGDVNLQLGRQPEALDYYQQSSEIRQSLAAAQPGQLESMRDLMVSYSKLGDANLAIGEMQVALKHFQQSLAVGKQLMELGPNDAETQIVMAVANSGIGKARLATGNGPESLEYFQAAVDMMSRLSAADPRNVDFKRNWRVSLYELAEAHKSLQQYEAAAAAYRDGITILREMIANDQSVEAAQRELVTAERYATAAQNADLALGPWDDLLGQPSDQLPELLEFRALELVKRDRFHEAAQAAAKLRELASSDSARLYNAACIFSRCAAAPITGQSPSAEQTRQQKQYIDEALATLELSIAAGWSDFVHMQRDPDLAPLRNLPEFQALVPPLPQ